MLRRVVALKMEIDPIRFDLYATAFSLLRLTSRRCDLEPVVPAIVCMSDRRSLHLVKHFSKAERSNYDAQ